MLDHAAGTAPTRQHEVEHTDQEDITAKDLDDEVGIGDLFDGWNHLLRRVTVELANG